MSVVIYKRYYCLAVYTYDNVYLINLSCCDRANMSMCILMRPYETYVLYIYICLRMNCYYMLSDSFYNSDAI